MIDDVPLPDDEYAPSLRIARPDDNPDWRSLLLMSVNQQTGKESPAMCPYNLAVMLEHHPDWRGVLRFDTFTDRIVLGRSPPFRRPGALDSDWSDQDDFGVQMWLDRHAMRRAPAALVRAAVSTVALWNKFNPVQDYLRALEWDGIERLPFWLGDVFGCDQTAYAAEVGTRWVMSAAKRALEPGCQADYAIVLEGPQGARKSTAVAALCPSRSWFTDELPAMGSKDAAIQVQGAWIIELAELDALAKSEVSAVKAFITRRVDKYRPPYGTRTVTRPRQCVLVGTVNPGDGGYLKDDTGNRRFWPITVKHPTANAQWVRENRDQLWAEAVARLARGEPWHIADVGVAAQATEEQEARVADDPWLATISHWAIGKEGDYAAASILADALKLDSRDHNRATQMRIGEIMRKLGWSKSRPSIKGVRMYVYSAPRLIK